MKFLSDWNSLIVGKTSPWLNLDSPNETVRKNSEQVRHCLLFWELALFESPFSWFSFYFVLSVFFFFDFIILAQNELVIIQFD